MNLQLAHVKRCIYCNQTKPASEFRSVEHIWPKAVGVKKPPALFLSKDVCDACNHTCGLWVDGAFTKSWVVTNQRMFADMTFLHPGKPSNVSLAYLGSQPDFPTENGWVCERWAGPSGEHIYHVHPKGDLAWETYVGGNPKKQNKKSAAGRAYIRLTADAEFWLTTAILSFHTHFKHSQRYCLTRVHSEWSGSDTIFPRPNLDIPVVKIESEFILNSHKKIDTLIPLDVGFSDRILCKIALGLGANILGNVFLESPYAEKLRMALREPEFQKRRNMGVRSNGFRWGEPDKNLMEILGYTGGWVVFISIVNCGLAVMIIHPDGNQATIQISDESLSLSDTIADRFGNGEVYVSIPSIKQFLGPFVLPEYLGHKSGIQLIPELHEVDSRKRDMENFPPKRQADIGKE